MIGQAMVGNRSSTRGRVWLTASFWILVSGSVAIAGGRGPRSKTTVSRDFYEGRELFVKVWEPGKPSPIGGDGLGPLYNEKSCVGCHHLGGTGGAGAMTETSSCSRRLPNPPPSSRPARFSTATWRIFTPVSGPARAR